MINRAVLFSFGGDFFYTTRFEKFDKVIGFEQNTKLGR